MIFYNYQYITVVLLFILFVNTGYSITTKTLSLEKGEVVALPIYLDDQNNSEEIKYISISISHDSDYFIPLGFRKDNGILSSSDYSMNEMLQIQDKAIVNINGSGIFSKFGSLVEFVLSAKETGTATIYLNGINCNDKRFSGGFWLEDEFYQKINVETGFFISEIEDLVVYEDQPVLSIPFLVKIPDEDPTGRLSITEIASSNTDVVPQNGMTTRIFNKQYTLLIFPTANAFGETFISITARYNEKEDTQTFLIMVKPVNDEPSFSIPSAITLPETSGPQVIQNWATNISPGAPNEADQELSFIVHVDQPDLFYSQPEIDPVTGDFTFFPSDNLNGQAQLSVYLKDNGDTLNEGRNLSTKKNCTLTITPFSPTISDNPVEKLLFISSNQPISIEKTTPYIRVIACDANGHAVKMESDTQIWLQTESPDTGWFYVQNNQWSWCQSNAIVVIPEGEHSAVFKYRNGRPGAFQIKASEIWDQNWSDAIMTVHVKPDSTAINGDIDGNGYIDLKDVIKEMQFLAEQERIELEYDTKKKVKRQ
jgi:hypothetical protein